jgi:hypothetical protein
LVNVPDAKAKSRVSVLEPETEIRRQPTPFGTAVSWNVATPRFSFSSCDSVADPSPEHALSAIEEQTIAATIPRIDTSGPVTKFRS